MAEEKQKQFHYGGQAIIEGVMMRGPKDFGVAVRRSNGEIVTTCENVDSVIGKFKWLDKPFLRGTLALIDSMALGIKALKYSADIAMADAVEEEAAKQVDREDAGSQAVSDPQAEDPKKAKVNDIAVGAMMVVGLVLGLALFMLVPIFVVKPLKSAWELPAWGSAALEGAVKITLFVGYVLAISLMKDIRRVFQYHGAEHKTINAYESKVELTVENVLQHTKVHVRCGTSFILVVLLASIVVFMFVPWQSIVVRFAYKLMLLPLVAGIAYEVIRFAGRHKESPLSAMLVWPGLLMQKITTREPEPEMVEVAIKSLQAVLEAEAAGKQEPEAV
jgi:uncharacterized protein YqhQ